MLATLVTSLVTRLMIMVALLMHLATLIGMLVTVMILVTPLLRATQPMCGLTLFVICVTMVMIVVRRS